MYASPIKDSSKTFDYLSVLFHCYQFCTWVNLQYLSSLNLDTLVHRIIWSILMWTMIWFLYTNKTIYTITQRSSNCILTTSKIGIEMYCTRVKAREIADSKNRHNCRCQMSSTIFNFTFKKFVSIYSSTRYLKNSFLSNLISTN